jgi:hypothetical protein
MELVTSGNLRVLYLLHHLVRDFPAKFLLMTITIIAYLIAAFEARYPIRDEVDTEEECSYQRLIT